MYGKKWKRTKWMIPLLAASLIMPFSSMGKAAMANEQPVTAEESGQFHRPVTNTARATSPGGLEVTNPGNESSTVGVGGSQKEEPTAEEQPTVTADGTDGLSYTKVYESMIALKDGQDTKFHEGKTWTNFYPYGTGEGSIGGSYTFRGGKIQGASGGVGCAAFAFILSDAAFGDIPARDIPNGQFNFDDVKVGDILRINSSHFVIVLQKSAGGVTVAEGNYNKSVHWGRAISAAEVEQSVFIITRYPEGFISADDATANEEAGSGKEGNLDWMLTKGGTLKITGNGDMPNYTADSRPAWEKVDGTNVQTIVIGKDVTNIGNYAFSNSTALSIYIPDGVKNIGESAFEKSSLLSVTIPSTVEKIGNKAFYMSPSLTSVTVSEGVKTIGSEAFRGCMQLAYVDFPASITEIGFAAFMSCTKITRVRFMPGTGTVTIGDNVFSQCQTLTSVTLPQMANCISAGMFESCISLFNLYIPKSVEKIGSGAFLSCRSGMTLAFGGSEAEWNAIIAKTPGLSQALLSITPNMLYNQEFVDPFAPIPGDPGDFNPDGTETPPEEPAPEVHEHNWSADWVSDENNHWHECGTQGCPVSDNSQKDGYAEHTYGSWVTDQSASAYQSGTKHRDCTVCGYQQSGTIPATGGSSSGSGSGSSGGSSWSPGGGSWSSGGNYWNPGSSSSGSSSNSSSSSTTDTDKTDTDKTDSSSNETDNNAGAVDNSGSENSSAGSDNNAGSTNDVEASENNTDNASSSVEIAKAKKQLKTEMKTQMKATMKTQIKKELKPQLKAQIKKLLKKQAQIKPKAKAKLKTTLKKDLKQELKAALKAKLKAQLKKEFGKQLGDQFIEEFNTQFNKQFNALYNEQFNKQFQTQFKQLTS